MLVILLAVGCRSEPPAARNGSPVDIPAAGPITIALTGDTSLFTKTDFNAIGATRDVVRGATVAFTNLEVNLLDHQRANQAASRPAPRWVFGPPQVAGDLRELGIDLVALANNHAMDFGPEGLASTSRALDEAGIIHAGAGRDLEAARTAALVGTTRRVALVAVTASAAEESRASASQQDIQGRPGVNPLKYSADITVDPATFRTLAASVATLNAGPPPSDREMTMFGTRIRKGDRTRVDFIIDARDQQEILDQVKNAKSRAELVIVSLHGHEPANQSDEPADFLRQFAHRAVDAGARVVVGHGPHRIRGAEMYNGGLIFYSLGNFIYQSSGLDFRAADRFDAGQNLYNVAIGGAPDAGNAFTQLDSERWWEGLLVVLHTENGELVGARVYPVDLKPDSRATAGLPALAQGARASAILRHFSELSQRLGSPAPAPAGAVLGPFLDLPISKNR